MKVLLIVAFFAFVAVQLTTAAPRPNDDKKEETPVSNAPAAESAPAQVPAVETSVSEVKAAEPAAEAVDPLAAALISENVKPAEDKKD